MSAPVRVSAVSFLNARPLVHGLEAEPALFDIEFDLPSVCAERLHAGEVDLGLIPSFEYLRGDYRLVPGVAIGSDGPILSVAIFTRVPMGQVRRLALDTSSRTSAALTRILCAKRWRIAPEFVPALPSLDDMLATADAALIIGDPALAIDPLPRGIEKDRSGARVAGADRPAVRLRRVGGPARRAHAATRRGTGRGARSRCRLARHPGARGGWRRSGARGHSCLVSTS
jgi:hypothetical protein